MILRIHSEFLRIAEILADFFASKPPFKFSKIQDSATLAMVKKEIGVS